MSHRHDVPLPSPAQDLYLYDGVEAGLAGIPDRAELRRRLRTSPLLENLNEDDLDSLAGGGRAVRFEAGEWIIDTEGTTSGLSVLWTGSARIVAEGPDGRTYGVAELVAGDVFGLLGRSERSQRPVRARAVTDCEVVSIDQAVAQSVTSRNPALASVLNQVLNARRRRFDRMMESALQQIALAAPSDESAGTTGSAEE
jgi:CRP-like cAMP-binding protein